MLSVGLFSPPSSTAGEARTRWVGVAYALAAGLIWGLVFVGPLLLPEYPAALQSVARYLVFGLVALPLAWYDRCGLARLTRADWRQALKLSAIGNLLYYLCLASAIQHAGAPLPTMIIGTLPLVISVCANQRNQVRDGRLPWRRLLPPLALILLGIFCVNQVELGLLRTGAGSGVRYVSGALLAVIAVACWTWYPLHNADWLRQHSDRNPRIWTTAQGLATLPMALCGYLLLWVGMRLAGSDFAMPFGPRPGAFIGMMLVIGLCAGWVGTLCWNQASQRLPTAMVGQLIVFETLSALCFAYLWRGQWPPLQSLLGIALLIVGVLLALRVPVMARAYHTPVVVTAVNEDHDETRIYAGVQWFLEQTPLTRPNLVLGIRKTKTDTANNVTGVELSYSYSLAQMQSDALRLGYLNGRCDVLGTLGVGYSLRKGTGLGYAGLVGPFATASVEVDGNKQLGLGLQLDTQRCAGNAD